MTRLPELATLPAVFAELRRRAPVDVLDEPGWLAALPSAESSDGCTGASVGDRIVTGKGCASLGRGRRGRWDRQDVEIRVGAYLRGGCWVGDNCVVAPTSR
jgi:hypothetical protein